MSICIDISLIFLEKKFKKRAAKTRKDSKIQIRIKAKLVLVGIYWDIAIALLMIINKN